MLYPCNDCRRFVRVGEACPFCGCTEQAPRERFTRVGRVFVAATAASTLTFFACSAYGSPVGPRDYGPYYNPDAAPDADASDSD